MWNIYKRNIISVSRMEWISDCDIQYNPKDGRDYIIYLDDGGMELASYNAARKTFVQIHCGQEFPEDDVRFVALITRPWSELKNDTYGNT